MAYLYGTRPVLMISKLAHCGRVAAT